MRAAQLRVRNDNSRGQGVNTAEVTEASWFSLANGEQRGPYSWEHLISEVRATRLRAHDLVWRPGLETWQPAGDISGLFTPPPPPDAKGKSHDSDPGGQIGSPPIV